jgi:hypothetical protein
MWNRNALSHWGPGLMVLIAAGSGAFTIQSAISEMLPIKAVSQDQYGEDWPFLVNSGMLVCELHIRGRYRIEMAVFMPDSGEFAFKALALNGSAKQIYPSADPVVRDDEKLVRALDAAGALKPGDFRPKVDTAAMIAEARALCPE